MPVSAETGFATTPDGKLTPIETGLTDAAREDVVRLVVPKLTAAAHGLQIQQLMGWSPADLARHLKNDGGQEVAGRDGRAWYVEVPGSDPQRPERSVLQSGFILVESTVNGAMTATHFRTLEGAVASFSSNIGTRPSNVVYPEPIAEPLAKPLMLIGKNRFVVVIPATLTGADLEILLAENPMTSRKTTEAPSRDRLHLESPLTGEAAQG